MTIGNIILAAAVMTAGAALAEQKGTEAKREALVFVGAHPDDSEGFAATAFRLKEKYDIHIVDLTRGELGLGRKGLEDGSTARRRTKEEEEACAFLGATPHFLHEVDGSACAGKPSVDALVKLLDELKPRAVFTHWPVDSHADHVQTAAVVANALRFTVAKPERYFFEVMFCQTANYRPLYYVDVTATIDSKLKMLSLYACQNSGNGLVDDNRNRAQVRGRERGVAFAETFTTFDGKRIPGGVLEPYALSGDERGGSSAAAVRSF